MKRVRGRLLVWASWLACRLPEALLVRLADLAGALWYRATPGRASQARRNLRRVASALSARGQGSPLVRSAATDPRALERLVRLAYRHAARYYVEVARTPAIGPDDLERRLVVDTPDAVATAFAGGPVIFVGLHFGAIELPALYLASRVGGAVAPMETVDDPELQAWFVRTRSAAGLRIVGLREARRELLAALRAGTSVGLVGDRDLTGGGMLIPLFDAPARLPLGPAMLAVESGAPMYVAGLRRDGSVGRYRGRLEPVAVSEVGSRRERITATTAALAAAFELVIADAPEQWWAVFFPIWPDLEAEVEGAAAAGSEAGTEPELAAAGGQVRGDRAGT